MTFEVKLLITFVATYPLVILTKFGQNRMKHVEEEANCEKKERKEELESTSASRHWYTGATNIDICFLMTSENVLQH